MTSRPVDGEEVSLRPLGEADVGESVIGAASAFPLVERVEQGVVSSDGHSTSAVGAASTWDHLAAHQPQLT